MPWERSIAKPMGARGGQDGARPKQSSALTRADAPGLHLHDSTLPATPLVLFFQQRLRYTMSAGIMYLHGRMSFCGMLPIFFWIGHAVANFMYAFGDSKEPLLETAEMVEELMLDYIQALLTEAAPLNANRWRASDILASLKRDPPKHARACDLLAKRDMQFFADSKGVIESSVGERLTPTPSSNSALHKHQQQQQAEHGRKTLPKKQ